MPARRNLTRSARAWIASALTASLIGSLLVAMAVFAPAATADEFTPTASLEAITTSTVDGHERQKSSILAGEAANYSFAISNPSAEDKFNVSFTVRVPNGVAFTSTGSFGAPKIYESGAVLPNGTKPGTELVTVPDGFQVWVWENISDLPAGADLRGSLTVLPDADTFPVGTEELELVLTAYTSDDPAKLPTFDGSTSVVTTGEHTSQPGSDNARTHVTPIRVFKTEPSPEDELVRGVHDNSTTYTIRVQNTGQAQVHGVTVTDYLPAGLEYLGAGGIDHTEPHPSLFGDDNDREYPGAASLVATPAPDGGTGDWDGTNETVETVELSDDAAAALGLGAEAGGVYTKVTWSIGALTGGAPQVWDTDAAQYGEYIIRYMAAVPLFENTMTWDVAPDGSDDGEAANLNNNNGLSTRHGLDPDEYDDAEQYRNIVHATGTYTGPSEIGAGASDTDVEVISAVDLHVLKNVDQNAFETGELATYQLDLATSEYTSADAIVLDDEIANGLCPALPLADPLPTFLLRDGTGDEEVGLADWNVAIGAVVSSAECAYPYAGGATSVLNGAQVDHIIFDEVTGAFTVRLLPVFDGAETGLTSNDSHQITYTVRQNPRYVTTTGEHGETSSGDTFRNEVTVQGVTHAIPPIDDEPALVERAGGDETVWDDSEAIIESSFSEITKSVLRRSAPIPGGDLSQAAESDWESVGTEPFRLGDSVHYRITVDFTESIDVRNPKLTDFLPQGVEFGGDYVVVSNPDLAIADGPDAGDNPLVWELGQLDPESGHRFVPMGTTMTFYITGEVTGLSASSEVLDQPQNLAKYQQQNVRGEVFFLRDAAEVTLDHEASLLKGIRSINGVVVGEGDEFNSNIDGLNVQQGDVVEFRVDVTGTELPINDLVVWDRLPGAFDCDDVSSGESCSDGIIEFAPVDLPGAAPDGSLATHTFTYTVVIPHGVAEAGASYVNTAAIVEYAAELNNGTTAVYAPQNDLRDTPLGAIEVPGEDAQDVSNVRLTSPSVAKSLDRTEVAPSGTMVTDLNNGVSEIVQGEHATFTYSVTIPALTTVVGAELADSGELTWSTGPAPGQTGYVVVDAETAKPTNVPTADWVDFVFDDATGTLTFPPVYTNATDEPQTFTVSLTVWVNDADESDPDTLPDLTHGLEMQNRATFESSSWSDDAHASVTYIEPNLSIEKSATPDTDVRVGTPIEYTLTVTNDTERPKTYDNVVVDAVPPGLVVTPGSFTGGTPSDVDPGVFTGDGGDITWEIAEISETATLTYLATIHDTTGAGVQYENTADVTGYTLPSSIGGDVADRRGDRASNDNATITVIDAAIEKGVRLAGNTDDTFTDSVSAPIGDTVEYELAVTLRANINYYEPTIVDRLPEGVTLLDATIDGPNGIPGTWNRSIDDNVVTWAFDGDIDSAPDERTVTLTYEVLLSNAVADDVNALPNAAEFTWNHVSGGGDDTRDEVDDDANVTVLNPVLAIEKHVNGLDQDTVELDESFEYTVTVRNTGDSVAYNIRVVDDVPSGVIVDGPISHGGELAGDDSETGNGIITWEGLDLPGPLEPNDSIELTYQARLAASAELSDGWLTNIASVEHYASFPAGGREYDPTDVTADAAVDPMFPYIDLAKNTVGTDIAYVGEPFTWELLLTNTGDGAAQTVSAIDTLPNNWEYVPGSAQVSIAGAEAQQIDPDASGSVADGQVLTWELGSATGDPLLAGTIGASSQSIRITFQATPLEGALDDAGAGSAIDHTNTLTAEATDVTRGDRNRDDDYVGLDAAADAHIHLADVAITKTAVDTPVVAGSGNTLGWTVVVENLAGNDPAVGPFIVTDVTGVLPDGVEIIGYSGTGWTQLSQDLNTDGTVETVYSYGDTSTVLAAGETLPELQVNVRVAADFDPADLPSGTVDNTVTVDSGTEDGNPDNNESSDDLPIITQADLEIVKSVAGGTVNAGGPISWAITVTNKGDSVSRSADGERITVSDVVPEGVKDVSVTTLPTGWTSSLAEDDVAQPNETITFTFDGEYLDVDATTMFGLTGTVLSSLLDDSIENTAVVQPGSTDDPVEENNTSTIVTEPEIDATLGITKSRVVQDDAGDWVAPTSDQPIVPGETVSYRVTVTNHGLADARGVQVVDELPEELSYVGIVDEQGSWSRDDAASTERDIVLVLDGTLSAADGANQASFIITATVAPDVVDEIVNTATASAENSTNEPSDSADEFPVPERDLSIAKQHTGDAVAGSVLPFTVTVTNEGPSISTGEITVVDTLPAGITYEPETTTVTLIGATGIDTSDVEPTITTDGSNQVLTWVFGTDASTLDVAGTITIDIETLIGDTVEEQRLVNHAEVIADDDTDESNNHTSDPIDVITRTTVGIAKTVEAAPWIAGTEVDYTITVTVEGPSIARFVSLSDIVPVGMTLTSIGSAGDGWDWDLASGSGTRDSLAVGTYEIPATVLIEASVADGTELENLAMVGWTDSDGPKDVGDFEEILVTAEADLELAKLAVDADGELVDRVVAGEPGYYQIAVTNHGPSVAVAPITVSDVLPSGVSYLGMVASGVWDCEVSDVDPSDVECVLPSSLDVDAAAPALTLYVQYAADITAVTLTNTASVTSPTTDPDESNNDDAASVDVDRIADLGIVKAHDESLTYRAGETIEYTLDVTNHGPSDSSGPITVTDVLPDQLSYVADSATVTFPGRAPASAEPVSADGELVWTLGDAAFVLAPSESITITFIALIDAATPTGEIINVTTVDGELEDPNPDNNVSEDPTDVITAAVVTIEKSLVEPGSHVAGEEVEFTLTVTNLGPSLARDLQVADVAPVGLTVTTISADGWDCDGSGCARDELAVGAPSTLTVTALIDASVPHGSTLENLGTVTWNDDDPETENEGEDPEPVDVIAVADLALLKTAVDADGNEVTGFTAGEDGNFTFTVTNHGPSDAARPLTIVDTLPAGVSYVDLVDSGEWECEPNAIDPQIIECSFPRGVAAGAAMQLLTMVVHFDEALPAEAVTNTAVVDSPTDDPVEENNTSNATVDVEQFADLAIVKSHDGIATIGESFVFAIDVHNDGPSTATGVTVTDVLPPSLTFLGAADEASAWVCVAGEANEDGTVVECELEGSIASGANAPTIELETLVTVAAYPEVINVASVTSETPDPDESDNSTQDRAEVAPLATLEVTKVSDGVLQVGEIGRYIITVTNTGPTEDPGTITVVDRLPNGLSWHGASGAVCGADGDIVTCEIEDGLAVGASVVITLEVRVGDAAYPHVTNTVTVSSAADQTDDAQLAATDVAEVKPAKAIASTGYALPLLAILLALLSIVLGALLIVTRRRTVEV